MATSVKLDDDLISRIRHLAEVRDCSPLWIMREAIRDYVEHEEKHEAFKHDALRVWEAYQENGLHLTLEEATPGWRSLKQARTLSYLSATSDLDAANKLDGLYMGIQPIFGLLTPTGGSKSIVGSAQHGDKHLNLRTALV